MSYRHVDAVRENVPRDLAPSARLVLALLASRAHHRDNYVRRYPVARIAWDSGYSARQVKRLLGELVDRGLIWPLHDPATIHRGRCQEYGIELLQPHHRTALKGDPLGTDPDLL